MSYPYKVIGWFGLTFVELNSQLAKYIQQNEPEIKGFSDKKLLQQKLHDLFDNKIHDN